MPRYEVTVSLRDAHRWRVMRERYTVNAGGHAQAAHTALRSAKARLPRGTRIVEAQVNVLAVRTARAVEAPAPEPVGAA